MSQQAQLKTTSVILKIDIINSPQSQSMVEQGRVDLNREEDQQPIKKKKPNMAQLKPMHTILATLVVLLVAGAVVYVAINGTQQQQDKVPPSTSDATVAATVASAGSTEAQVTSGGSGSATTGSTATQPAAETPALNRLSSQTAAATVASSELPSPTSIEPTTFGRPATTTTTLAASSEMTSEQQATSQQMTSTTTAGDEQEVRIGSSSGRMFGAPVSALATPQAANVVVVVGANETTAATIVQSTSQSAEQASPTQPVQIQEAKMSVLLNDPTATEPPSSPSASASPTSSTPQPAVEMIPIQSISKEVESAPPASPPPSSLDKGPAADPLDESWEEFKAMYKRQYPNPDEELKRKEIFKANSRFIASHNEQKDQTYKLAMNHFGDFTREEINQLFVGPQISWSETISHLQTPVPPPINILNDPNEPKPHVDWRNITTGPPVDQGACHESSVYAAVASMEAQLNKLSAAQSLGSWEPIKLAESQVLDCMRLVAPPNAPPICLGYSSMLHVFDLLQRSPLGGLVSAAEYHDFVAHNRNSVCDLPPPPQGFDNSVTSIAPTRAKLSSFMVVNRENIPEALVNTGPLVVALDASQSSFHFYKSGLYHDQNCSTDFYNHHALLVGLQPLGAELLTDAKRHNSAQPDQYMIRNSFGLDWGEGGHMRLLKVEDNKCLPQMLAVGPN